MFVPPAALMVAPHPPAPPLAAGFCPGWGLWWKSIQKIQDLRFTFFSNFFSHVTFHTHFGSTSYIFVTLKLIQNWITFMNNNNCFDDQIKLFDWNHFFSHSTPPFTFPFYVFIIIQQEILKKERTNEIEFKLKSF